MEIGPGKVVQCAEFPPGFGLEFHAVQEHNSPLLLFSGSKIMNVTGITAGCFFSYFGHKSLVPRLFVSQLQAGREWSLQVSDIIAFVNG